MICRSSSSGGSAVAGIASDSFEVVIDESGFLLNPLSKVLDRLLVTHEELDRRVVGFSIEG